MADKAVKYIVAVFSAAAIAAVIAFIGSGYLMTRRADRKAEDLRSAVHAMSLQDLAAAMVRCDAPFGPGAPRPVAVQRDAAYCESVARELDDRPLEIVEMSPAGAPPPPVAPPPAAAPPH